MPDGIPTFEESIMPRTTIKACAKTVLHADTAIQKDALTALAKGSSVFISYLTTHANEIALSKKRKTIMPSDVFDALKVIEYERFVPELKEFHERAELEAKEKRDRKKSGASVAATVVDETDVDELAEAAVMPPPKRVRVENEEDAEMHEVDERTQPDAQVQEEEIEDDDHPDEQESEDEVEETDELDSGAAAGQLNADPIEDLDDRQKDDYDEALDDGEDSD